VRLEDSPYAFVRTRVMYSLLLKKADYEKLLHMNYADISYYLAQHQYRQEMEELATKYEDIELIEHALAKNLLRTMEKLARIYPPSYESVLQTYLLRYDVENIKTIARGIVSGKDTGHLLLPVGQIKESHAKATSLDALWSSLPVQYRQLPHGTLAEAESSLDRYMHDYVIEFAKTLPAQANIFAQFFKDTVEMTNIITLLRLRRDGVDEAQIKKHLFLSHTTPVLKALLDNPNTQVQQLQRYDIEVDNLDSLIPVEVQLYRRLYHRMMQSHRSNPDTVAVVLSFLFAKEMEFRNLRTLAKGKHFGLDTEEIKEYLVIG